MHGPLNRDIREPLKRYYLSGGALLALGFEASLGLAAGFDIPLIFASSSGTTALTPNNPR